MVEVYIMSVTTEPTIAPTQLEHYQRQGWVRIPGLISGALLEQIQIGHRRAVAGEVLPEEWAQRWGPDRLLQLPGPSTHLEELADRAHVRIMEAVGRALMGDDIHFAYDQLIMKPPSNPHPTPWHQDSGYWQGRQRGVTCWLAVEDVAEDMGCMRFIPGSHREGMREHRSVADRNPISGALEATVDESAAVAIPLRAGDVTFHHCRTLHHTTGNRGERPRCGLVTHLWGKDPEPDEG